MILNLSKLDCENALGKEINVGGAIIPRSSSTKLLGIEIDDKQLWKQHLNEVLGSLNMRTFTIRRISNQLPKQEILKVVQCIWMSKLRYGLQLCNQVRTCAEDPTNTAMTMVQGCQNKMLRMLDRVSLTDHVTSISLLKKYSLSSVNQLSAEIKLTEAWKSTNVENYPFQMEGNNPGRIESGRSCRTGTRKLWKDDSKSMAAKISFSRDTAKLWNNAPIEIKSATTLGRAKAAIKKHCKTLEF